MTHDNNGRGGVQPLPMSGPGHAGRPVPYRVIWCAEQQLDRAHTALFTLREHRAGVPTESARLAVSGGQGNCHQVTAASLVDPETGTNSTAAATIARFLVAV